MITRYFINSHGVYKVANLVVYMITSSYFIYSHGSLESNLVVYMITSSYFIYSHGSLESNLVVYMITSSYFIYSHGSLESNLVVYIISQGTLKIHMVVYKVIFLGSLFDQKV